MGVIIEGLAGMTGGTEREEGGCDNKGAIVGMRRFFILSSFWETISDCMGGHLWSVKKTKFVNRYMGI